MATQSSSVDPSKELCKESKIVVVGAGLAGLCSCLALAQQGYQVEVYEQLKPQDLFEESPNSIPITLGSSTLSMMENYGANMQVEDIQEDLQGVQEATYKKEKGWGQFFDTRDNRKLMMEHLIRQRLQRCVEQKYKDEIKISFASECTGVDFERNYIKVQDRAIPYDFLVACDGQDSVLRRQFQKRYPNKLRLKRKDEHNLLLIEGLPEEQNNIMKDLSKQLYFLSKPPCSILVWQNWTNRECKILGRYDEGLSQPPIEQIIDGYKNILPQSWIQHLQQNPNIIIKQQVVGLLSRLSVQNVVFIGDSGHPSPYNIGDIGPDVAIRDSKYLIESIKQDKVIENICQRYTDIRLKQVQDAQKFEGIIKGLIRSNAFQKYFLVNFLITYQLQQLNKNYFPQKVVFPSSREILNDSSKLGYHLYVRQFQLAQIILWGFISSIIAFLFIVMKACLGFIFKK